MGAIDSACHAYKNRTTERTKYMFNEGGKLYIFVLYGMHTCLNITAEKQGNPEAVLIRAVEPLEEIDTMRKNRDKKRKSIKPLKLKDLTNGAGKLCAALDIHKNFNGRDLVTDDEIYLLPVSRKAIVDSS